jgi:hypothetical protein
VEWLAYGRLRVLTTAKVAYDVNSWTAGGRAAGRTVVVVGVRTRGNECAEKGRSRGCYRTLPVLVWWRRGRELASPLD